jgi:hypothetical protein
VLLIYVFIFSLFGLYGNIIKRGNGENWFVTGAKQRRNHSCVMIAEMGEQSFLCRDAEEQ